MGESIQGAGFVEFGRARRMVCLIAALALVLGGVALVQAAEPAGAAPAAVSVGGGVAALGTSLGAGTAVAQIDIGALIRAIVCPILAQLASGPFGPLIGSVIAALRARFGCISA